MKRPGRLAWPATAGKLNLCVMSAAFMIFGLSMIFQAHRWASTPAYHVLLQIFRGPQWGILFLIAGAGLGTAALQSGRRWMAVASLTFAFCLTTGWMLAFVVRYLTSGSTTPETWVSWAVFDYLLLRAAASMDWPVPPPPSLAEVPPGTDVALTAINEARRALRRAEEAYARATGQPAQHTEPQ